MLFLIIITAFLASCLTFFSGFGLGTILLPVMVWFFPAELAVTITAIVHLLNNLLKTGLLWGHIDRNILIKFGLPGIIGAAIGAYALSAISTDTPIPINKVIGGLMIIFALVELIPTLKRLQFNQKFLIPGGLLSGFFGGLSGHQGALRSMFLITLGMSKEAYIATGTIIACLIDVTRIPMYLASANMHDIASQWPIITAAVISSTTGVLIGRRLLQKVTIASIQNIVGLLILAMGISLIAGWL